MPSSYLLNECTVGFPDHLHLDRPACTRRWHPRWWHCAALWTNGSIDSSETATTARNCRSTRLLYASCHAGDTTKSEETTVCVYNIQQEQIKAVAKTSHNETTLCVYCRESTWRSISVRIFPVIALFISTTEVPGASWCTLVRKSWCLCLLKVVIESCHWHLQALISKSVALGSIGLGPIYIFAYYSNRI